MSNTIAVIDMVAKEALAIAHEKATFISTINRDFDETFTSKGNGSIGATLRVREPNMYTRRQGSRVMNVQDTTEITQTITMATQDGVDMRFNSAELTTDLDGFNEFSKRHIQPAISSLISGIDSDCITTATKQTYNLVGTAGTVVGASDITALGQARAKLNQGLAPKDNRSLQLDSTTMAAIVNKNLAIFSPGAQVSEAFAEGFYSRSAMADFYENERTYTHTGGSDHTTVTVATTHLAADGGTTLTIVNGVGTVGDIFTVAGVYACHPETKISTGALQQFTVLTVVGSVAFTVSPTMYWTGARTNMVTATSGTVATTTFDSNPVVTMFGADSGVYRQNLMYNKDAFTFVTAALPNMGGECTFIKKDGIGLRVWKMPDIRNDEMLMRVDILWGFKTLRPAWACRVSN